MPSDGVNQVTLRLLGSWRLSSAGQQIDLPLTARRVVALLALRGPLSRASVACTLWPEAAGPTASSRLRTALWRLAQVSRLVDIHAGEMTVSASVSVDVGTMLQAARTLIAAGRAASPSDRSKRNEGEAPAADLFEEDLLPGWDDEWLAFERERIRQIRLHALEALSLLMLRQTRYAEAVDAGLAAVRAEPLRESAHRAVIRAHLAEGNMVEAIRQFQVCRKALREELGVAPSAELAGMLAGRLGERYEREFEPAVLSGYCLESAVPAILKSPKVGS